MHTKSKARVKRFLSAIVLALMAPAFIGPVARGESDGGGGGTNYAAQAVVIAHQLLNAETDEAAFEALMSFLDTANVTVVGESGGQMEVVSQGFGLHTRKDLFLLED